MADPNDEIIYDIEGNARIYKSGGIERFKDNNPPFISLSIDSVTGVSYKDLTISTDVSARIYLPKLDLNKKLPILIYYHGGAFFVGSAFDSPWHNFVASVVSRANVIAVSVQYRLAPEHPIPIPYEDSFVALDWIVSHANGGSEPWLVNHGDFNQIFIGGDSAGANIAHHVAMYGGTKIRGVVLIHPYFLSSQKVESENFDPIMTKRFKDVWKAVSLNKMDLDDPWINPLVEGAPQLNGLACNRVLVLVGGMDILRDRGRAYYEKLKESGWKGEVRIWEAAGEGHCFHFFKPECELAKEQDRIIVEFLNMI
ncbi:hypothetical protein LUZ60_002701 [Juncus effusus]|nr:hypothetical protein LUZ60_002701 [Juncus effusus]